MTTELMSIEITGVSTVAVYRASVAGAETVIHKDRGWSVDVLNAAGDLLDAIDGAGAPFGPVVRAMVYSTITDNRAILGASARGDLVDAWYDAAEFRFGADAAVPETIAAARDALKAAIIAAITPA